MVSKERAAGHTKNERQVQEAAIGGRRKEGARFGSGRSFIQLDNGATIPKSSHISLYDLCTGQNHVVRFYLQGKSWLAGKIHEAILSLRRKTTICQKVPADCIPKLVSFITHLRQMQTQHKYTPRNMFAMDKTACWMDMPQLLLLVVVLFPSKQLDMKRIRREESASGGNGQIHGRP